MKVSVIIPTYNRSEHLTGALRSVLMQSHPASEIIVVDDGSTDDTAALLASEFGQVTTLTIAHQGVSAARNAGIKQARHPWLAFLDSDDLWQAHKLAEQARAYQNNPEHRIFHSDETWVRNGVRVNAMVKHKKPTGWIYPQCLPLCCVSPSSIIIHKEVLEECGDFDTTLPACEDYDLWLRLFSRHPVHLVDQALVIKHGGHPDQLSRRYWGMDRFRVLALDKILKANVLSDEYAALSIATLKHKCEVLVKGARKRDNHAVLDQYQAIATQY